MPLIPFLLGIVVGSAITYVAKDDASKSALKSTGGKITDGFGALTEKATHMFKKDEDAVDEVVEKAEVVDVEDGVVAS